MATTNFNWTDNTGADFETEANTTFEEIDASFSAVLDVPITSANQVTLTNSEFRTSGVFVVDEDTSDPAYADFDVFVPAIKRGIFTIVNDTAFTATVQISGQSKTAPTVATNTTAILTTDATDVTEPT